MPSNKNSNESPSLPAKDKPVPAGLRPVAVHLSAASHSGRGPVITCRPDSPRGELRPGQTGHTRPARRSGRRPNTTRWQVDLSRDMDGGRRRPWHRRAQPSRGRGQTPEQVQAVTARLVAEGARPGGARVKYLLPRGAVDIWISARGDRASVGVSGSAWMADAVLALLSEADSDGLGPRFRCCRSRDVAPSLRLFRAKTPLWPPASKTTEPRSARMRELLRLRDRAVGRSLVRLVSQHGVLRSRRTIHSCIVMIPSLRFFGSTKLPNQETRNVVPDSSARHES